MLKQVFLFVMPNIRNIFGLAVTICSFSLLLFVISMQLYRKKISAAATVNYSMTAALLWYRKSGIVFVEVG